MRKHSDIVMVADDEPAVARTATRILALRYHVTPPVIELDDLAKAVAELEPDILFLDIMWRSQSALDILPVLRRSSPALHICILSGHRASAFIRDAFGSGALGYLTKPTEAREYFEAAEAVRRDRVYLAPELRQMPGLCDWVEHHGPVPPLVAVVPVDSDEFHRQVAWLMYSLDLTRTQARVALVGSWGREAKQIAATLGRMYNTVTGTICEIYERLSSRQVTTLFALGRVVGAALAEMPREWRPAR